MWRRALAAHRKADAAARISSADRVLASGTATSVEPTVPPIMASTESNAIETLCLFHAGQAQLQVPKPKVVTSATGGFDSPVAGLARVLRRGARVHRALHSGTVHEHLPDFDRLKSVE